jgi:8-oxo-dGTP pyrophosphatase MutT (NUDIX family)
MNKRDEKFTLRAAVYLIPIKGNKVLLSRRYQTGWMDGKYSLIAGHIDGNESVFTAMIREASEEAGIRVRKKDLIPVKIMHRKSDREYIDFFFVAKKWNGTPKIMEPEKCDDLRWFPLNKLPRNLLAYVKEVIDSRNDDIPLIEYGWK